MDLAIGLAEALSAPFFYISYAAVQAVVMILVIRYLDLFEREPLGVIALIALWGGTGAIVIALLLNGAFQDPADPTFVPTVVAPIVEEVSKGLALLAAFFASRWVGKRFGVHEFEGVSDGLVYGAAVGLGFAFSEDVLYFFNFASQNGLQTGVEVFLLRADFFGIMMLMHSMFTAMFGAGLGMASLSRTQAGRIGWPLAGLGLAIAFHAAHNRLAVSGSEGALRAVDWGFVIVFLVAMGLWLRYQRQILRFEIAEEVNAGLISKEEWELLPQYRKRTSWYWQLLRGGHLLFWRQARKVHAEMADLAFLKWRIRRVGGDWAHVERARQHLAQERAQLAAMYQMPAPTVQPAQVAQQPQTQAPPTA